MFEMKSKRVILPVVLVIVCVVLVIIWLTAAIKGNSNKQSFQSETEMSEVLNGTWRTGDSEFDFILTIANKDANLSMDGKDDNGASSIVYVPEKGYFYFVNDGDNKDDRYYLIKDNGKWQIENGNWIFEKVK